MNKRALVLATLMLTAIFSGSTTSVSATPCADYDDSIQWQGMAMCGQVPIGGFALDLPNIYAATGEGVWVIDVSDPTLPESSRVLDIECYRIWQDDDLVLLKLVSSGSLVSLDFSDPMHPVVLDTLNIQNSHLGGVKNVEFFADRAYVAANDAGLLVIDVSDPANMQEVNSWTEVEYVYGVEIHQGIAYVATGRALHLLDLSDPDHPVEIESITGPRLYMNHHGDYLATANGYTTQVFNISDPIHPVLLESTEDFHVYYYLAVSEDFLAFSEGGFTASVKPLGELEQQNNEVVIGNQWGNDGPLAIEDGMLFKAGSSFLEIYDLAGGASVEAGPSVTSSSTITDVEYKNGYAFVAGVYPGLQIFTVPDTGEMELVAESNSMVSVGQIELHEDWAILAGSGELTVMDISDPYTPMPLGSFTGIPPGDAYFVLNETTAWFRSNEDLLAYDISDPSEILWTHTFNLGSYPMSMTVGNETLFVVCNDNSFRTYSLENGQPELLSSVEMEGRGEFITVEDGLAAVNLGWKHLLFEVSDPAHPEPLGEFYSWAYGETTIDENIMMTSDEYSLRYYDISDPGEPVSLGNFWTHNRSHVNLPGGGALSWNQYHLEVVPGICAEASAGVDPLLQPMVRLDVSPNPFNPRTVLEFNLPKAGFCQLVIHDLRGREIKKLCAENRPMGPQQFTWEGIDDSGRAVPSGVYLVRLVHDGGVETRKMALIR